MQVADFADAGRQAVVWFAGGVPDLRELMALTVGDFGATFNGDPVMLPMETPLPPEAPRFVVASKDKNWRLQVGPARADVFWERGADGSAPAPESFSQTAKRTFKAVLGTKQGISVTRMAFVVNRFAMDPSPARTMALHFFRAEVLAGPLRRPEGMEIHAHKTYSPLGMPKVNSWVRWRSAMRLSAEAPCIALEQDLNTLGTEGTESARFTEAEVDAFFDKAPCEALNILSVYLTTSAIASKGGS